MCDSQTIPEAVAADTRTSALFSHVYERLKALAGARLACAPRQESLDATALVHELFLRIGKNEALQFAHPSQFFGYAARAMRHLLHDRARDRLRLRAGGEWLRVTLTGDRAELALDSAERALELEQALQKLEAADARAARVVELRYFAGLTLEQAAEVLALTRRTIDRDWRFARAFLKSELG